ncbi:hypothetical protein RFI_00856 [Reticulomyxa filosa]|uniref:Uncharacterized protein n=1 Tax=Reticulomyxa filosa TaxID=46433 RepID=X6PEU9_RETFI|nr:hypothetical protein RFI_00856 [Reticulomyxa filosa]|eukprot:ETO36207.1 hypothetical protein RFI_00856 [Reticulomyxa filosa]
MTLWANVFGNFLASFLSIHSLAISGLGEAILFQIFFYIFDLVHLISQTSFVQVATKYSILALPVACVQLYYLRKYVQIKLGVITGLFSVPGVILGIEALIATNNIWLRRSLGFTLLLSSIANAAVLYYLDKRKKYQKQIEHIIAVNLQPLSSQPNQIADKQAENVNKGQNQSIEMQPNLKDDPSSPLHIQSVPADNMFVFYAIHAGTCTHTCTKVYTYFFLKKMFEQQMDMNTDEKHEMIEMERSEKFVVKGWKQWSGLLATASISGFMHGMFGGVSGPPFMIWGLLSHIDKNTFRGILIARSFFLVIPFLVELVFVKKQLNIQDYLDYIAIITGACLGLPSGYRVGRYVNQELFRKWLQILLFLGALLLSTAGWFEYTVAASCLGGVILIAYAVFLSDVTIFRGIHVYEKFLKTCHSKQDIFGSCLFDINKRVKQKAK